MCLNKYFLKFANYFSKLNNTKLFTKMRFRTIQINADLTDKFVFRCT